TFAGVNYNINISKQAGSRVENLCYPDGTAVKDADTIYLTSNDYRTSSKLTGDLFKDDNVTVIHKTADDQLGAVRDMIAQYISSVKKGTISNSFTANWKLTGTNFNLEKRALAANLVNSGKLSIPQVDNGKNYNAKSLTEKDVESFLAQEPKLVCKDASGKALDAGSIVSIKKNNVLTFTVEFPVSVNYSVGNGSVAQTGTVHPLAGSQTVYTVRAVGKSGQQVGVYLDGRKVFAVQVAA
ncbi:MAG: 5'-nucleotidase C-terminal domain-containing protein, partial [Oscillospiraceae bacterium]|nr:5'-nucleotidase C-terminal domain-containing protein [Oscillospiraceae bacterium]